MTFLILSCSADEYLNLLFPSSRCLSFSRPLSFLSTPCPSHLTPTHNAPAHRQYLGVCRAGDSAAVSVWDVAARKRLRFLSCAEMVSERYVAAAFSPDERMVAAQGGPPDWTLVLFLWEKGKVGGPALACVRLPWGSVGNDPIAPCF